MLGIDERLQQRYPPLQLGNAINIRGHGISSTAAPRLKRRRAGHRTSGACDGGIGGTGLRPGAPTAGGGGAEVLLTRISGLGVSGLVACSLVTSAASLSTLWRTAARLRDM